MKKADPRKLVLAKAELKRAMGARNPDPKRIAEAAAKVAIADPASKDIFFCHVQLLPLFRRLLKGWRFKSLDARALRVMVRTELKRVKKEYKIQLSSQHERMAVSVFIGALRVLWKKSQKKNERKSKKR